MILGIDTSCDDTSISVYSSTTNRVLSNVISSQYALHKDFGGIVPEIAARSHADVIDIVFKEALDRASVGPKDIKLVCATNKPGLVTALLVGLTFGKTLSFSLGVPFKSVNHIEAHMFSPFIEKEVNFPFLSLIVSGGHTLITVSESIGKSRVIGETLDDAVGEAYDKVARILGLGYPGGPAIDKIYHSFKGNYLPLPKPKVNGLNFSFSGLKTATKLLVDKGYDGDQIAASFQKTAIDYLISKLEMAINQTKIKRVAISGGVSANLLLRERLIELGKKYNLKVFMPEMEFASDNGAMIAFLGYKRFLFEGPNSLSVNAFARASL